MKCTPKVRQTNGGAFLMEKSKRRNKKYSPEFKISVILDMREHELGYRETARKYNLGSCENQGKNLIRDWERVYLEEGEIGFMVERRGRTSAGRPRKEPIATEIENDLIAENQRLRERNEDLEMELEYLKKLDALIQAEEQKKKH